MKSTMIRLALGLCILALASTAAWAVPPQCVDVCTANNPTKICSDGYFVFMRCSDWCSMNPDFCYLTLTDETPVTTASCQASLPQNASGLPATDLTLDAESLPEATV